MEESKLHPGKKIYFISDLHLGAPNPEKSRKREDLFLRWLEEISADAQALYLVGDIFDFWFEYKHVVPRGFVRTLGKLAELTDKGLPIYFFKGNHDMWTFDYLEKEVGIQVVKQPYRIKINDKRFFVAHGDGLGPGENFYKFLKWFFNSWFCQRLFAFLHPYIGMSIAQGWSKKSRTTHIDESYQGDEKEFLVNYCKDTLLKEPETDYFVFGHRHLPLEIDLEGKAKYVNLGDWLRYFTFGVFDGDSFQLENYKSKADELL